MAALVLGALASAAGLSCVTTGTTAPRPTLAYEQHTLRIPLKIEPGGSVSLAERPPLSGRLDLSPVLAAEGIEKRTSPISAQGMVHYGRLYVISESFRSLWEVTPQPGTATATYREIRVAGGDPAALAAHAAKGAAPADRLKDVRLSRYGSSGSSCLRLDYAGGAPLFITPEGEARDACP